jgi:hypothetical protein
MAKDKNAIIVYADWIDKFEELEDDEAGRLIKHFFRYVNDLNPEYPDKLTKIAFIDIKNSLKRDLGKWEQTLEFRSKAGKASAEARRLLKLNQQDSTKVTPVDFVKKNSTNPTDSVTVSVSVSDTVTDSVNEKSISNSSFKEILKKNEKWINGISTEFKISTDEVVEKLNQFYNHLSTSFIIHPSLNEFAKHFKSWFRVNKEKNGKSNSTKQSNQNSGYKPATVDREKLIRELANDAANGNIPGNYITKRT